MKLQLKKNIETSDVSVFLQSDKEPLFTRIKFHYNRMLVKGPYLSCEVKTWIIISYGKPKMQKLKLAMSIVLGEKFNSWQSPNVLRRPHNCSKLMRGHTYKLVSKYLKITVYLIAFFLSVLFFDDRDTDDMDTWLAPYQGKFMRKSDQNRNKWALRVKRTDRHLWYY